MKESAFWLSIKPIFNGCDAQRIDVTSGRGVPDVNMVIQGKEVWIELKIAYKGQFFLRKEQYVWGLRRTKVGGHVFSLGYDHLERKYYIWKAPFPVIHGGKYLIVSKETVNSVLESKSSLMNELYSLLP